MADFLKISAADANVEERTSKRLIKFKPQCEAYVHHFYSRSSPSAVRHATYYPGNGPNAPKPWQRLRHQQDPLAELSFLQSASGLTDLVKALWRRGWVRSLLGGLAPKAQGLQALEGEIPQSAARLERALNPAPRQPHQTERQTGFLRAELVLPTAARGTPSPKRAVRFEPSEASAVLITNLPWLGSHGLQPGSTMAPTVLPTRTYPGAGQRRMRILHLL